MSYDHILIKQLGPNKNGIRMLRLTWRIQDVTDSAYHVGTEDGVLKFYIKKMGELYDQGFCSVPRGNQVLGQ